MERSCTYARGRWRDDSIRQKRHGKIGEKMGHACRRRGMEPLGAGVVDLTHVGVRRGSDRCGRVEYAARVKGRRQPVSQLTRRARCVMGALPLGSANGRGEQQGSRGGLGLVWPCGSQGLYGLYRPSGDAARGRACVVLAGQSR
jgi:hypothetical protein